MANLLFSNTVVLFCLQLVYLLHTFYNLLIKCLLYNNCITFLTANWANSLVFYGNVRCCWWTWTLNGVIQQIQIIIIILHGIFVDLEFLSVIAPRSMHFKNYYLLCTDCDHFDPNLLIKILFSNIQVALNLSRYHLMIFTIMHYYLFV